MNIWKSLLIVLSIVFISTASSFFDNTAIKFVLEHEGGYCHNHGWKSNYGISSRWYSNYDFKNMTVDTAIAIYRRDYWIKSGASEMKDTIMALLIFDTSVLFGVPTAKKLSKGCNNYKDYLFLRLNEHLKQIKKNSDLRKYLLTWTRRISDLNKKIEEK